MARDPIMRPDVAAIGGRALPRQTRVYIFVHNTAEGSSPLTIPALARQLAESRGADATEVRPVGS